MAELEYGSVEHLRALTEKLVRERLLTSCITCAKFNHEKEECAVWSARPPAQVIVLGCPAWNDLPF